MPEQNGNSRVLLKAGLPLVLIAAVAVAAFYWSQEDATVAVVSAGTAVEAVSGSVLVHADGDVKELKSEVAGKVASCLALDPAKPFKKGDVLVQLDTAEMDRAMEQAKRDLETQRRRLEIEFSDNAEWTAVEQKLNDAIQRRQLSQGSEEEVNRLQDQLDEIVFNSNLGLKAAKDRLENGKRLQKHNEISTDAFKQLEHDVTETEKGLRLAAFDNRRALADQERAMEERNRQLEKMKIRAPEDGTAYEVRIWPGALINGGQVVATFRASSRVVVGKIGEEDFGKIKEGQLAKVRLLIYGSQPPFDAKVSKILPAADPETQLYTVFLDVAVDPAKLPPNASGQVNITVGEHPNVPWIQRRAVFDDNHVCVVKNGRVELRTITPGYKSLNKIEVTEGLALGEQVIVENVRQFHNGQHVRATVHP